MSFKFSGSRKIIGIAAIAMIGLSSLQYAWLKEAIQQKEQEIITKVNTTLEEVSAEWRTAFSINWIELEVDTQLQNETFQVLDSLLLKELSNKQLPTEFNLGLFNSDQSKILLPSHYKASLQDLSEASYQTCISCLIRINFVDQDTLSASARRVGFILEHDKEHLIDHMNIDEEEIWYLHLYFPKWTGFLFTKARRMFGLSLLFSCLLIASFFYVFRQWRSEQQLNAFKADFINNLTHEFKTPLASILLATKTLQLFPQQEGAQKLLDLIRNEGDKMENRVENILQLGIIESGNLQLDLQKTDFNQLIKNTLRRFELLIEQKSAKVSLTLDPAIPEMILDPLHMENVFYNLIDNALKYIQDPAKIHISSQLLDNSIRFSIQDNGIGIPLEDQSRIFDKFYRSDGLKISGSGLGLNYVKQITSAHRGKLQLDSVPQQGSTFHIELPLNA